VRSFFSYKSMKVAILLIAFLSIVSVAKSQPGTLDQDFGTQGGYTRTSFFNGGAGFHGIAIQSDGKIVAAGDEHKGSKAVFALARYNSDGRLDTSFGSGGKIFTDFDGGNDRARRVAVQKNGKIVVAGYTYNGKNYDFAIVRYNHDGKLDNGFGDRGKVITAFGDRNDLARSMVLQPDGMILVAGEFWKEENVVSSDFVLARYKSNGKLDEKFGSDGSVITDFGEGDDKARSVVVQADGKIIVAGQSYISRKGFFSLVRYNPNGSLDTSFGDRGDGKVVTDVGASENLGISLALQPDGKILLTGEANNGNNLDFALARYNSNGRLDTSFGSGGKVLTDFGGSNDHGRSIVLQADGKIIVAGQTRNGNREDAALARYNPNGSLDTSFGERENGKVATDFGGVNESINAAAIVGERLLVVGNTGADADTEDALIAAYLLAEEEVEERLLSVVVEKDAAEDDKDGFFEIAVSKAFTTDVTISYSLSGTAQKGSDYSTEPEAEEVVLKAGKTSVKVKISPQADTEVEQQEEVILTLAEPSISGLVLDEAKKAATLKITDNDEEVEDILLSVARGKDAAEDNTNGEFIISLSAALEEDLSIRYSLSGTAREGTDYEAVGEEVVLPAGQTSVNVAIAVVADTEVEDEETVTLTLQAPATAGVVLDPDENKQKASLAIEDNDEEPLPVVVLSVAKGEDAGEPDQQGQFIISASIAPLEDLTISYSLSGTAAAGQDYTTPGEQVVLKAGQTSVRVAIAVTDDQEVEEEETVILALEIPATAGVELDEARKSATLTITDNDEEVEDMLLSVAVAKDAAEPDQNGHFIISASRVLDKDLIIGFTLSGTAGTEDYSTTLAKQEVVLKAGQTTAQVPVQVKDDEEVEGEETVLLELLPPAMAGVVLDEKEKTAGLKIEDDDEEEDEVALLSVKVDKHAAEDAEDGYFIISTSLPLLLDVPLFYSLSGSATAGADYTSPGEQVILPAGQTSVRVPVAVLADTEVEEQEIVVLTLQSPSLLGLILDEAKKAATLTITDDDEAVEERLLSVVVEKDAAEDDKDGFFEIAVSKAFSTDVTISYKLTGAAQKGSDYSTEPEAEEVVLKAGKTSVKVKISPKADTEVEQQEEVILTLAEPSIAGLVLDEAKKAATVKITDNDEEPEDVILSVVKGKDAAEDNTNGEFIISLSAALEEDLSIRYNLSGTATEGTDYEDVEEQVVLPAGQTSVNVSIGVIADAEVEDEETVTLTLQAPATAGVVLDPDQNKQKASLAIEDNDEEPLPVVVLSVAKGEDAGEPDQQGQFIISASIAPLEDLTISYSLSGTAAAGQDYTSPGEQVVLKAGQTSVRVAIAVTDDQEVEEEETVILALEIPATTGVELDEARKSAVLTITDDDEEPVPVIVLSVAKGEDAAEPDQQGHFIIRASIAPQEDLDISFRLEGTAVEGEDYETVSQQLILGAGQTSVEVQVKVKDDQLVEQEETVSLTLNPPTQAGVALDEAKKAATVKITDNDEEPEVEDVLISVEVATHANRDDKDGEFEIKASQALDEDITINYSFSGTAKKDNEYSTEPAGEQLVLKAGKTSAKVKVKKQKKVVGKQTVVLQLTAPAREGVVLDQNNDSATMEIQSQEEVEDVLLSVVVEKDAGEDNKDGFFELKLSKALDTDLTIGFALTGTATAGTDYVSPGEQLLLKAGRTSIKIKIAVKADAEVEGEETVILSLQTPATAGVVLDEENQVATLKIQDNDEEPEEVDPILLSVTVAKDAEEDNKDGEFEILVSEALDEDLLISYSLSGTATAGTDYEAPEGQLLLKAGKKKEKVKIKVLADTEAEEQETVVLELAVPAMAGVVLDETKKAATLKIQDNDEEEIEPALLSVSVEKDAAEDDQDGFFEITLSKALETDLTVSYTLSGTAQRGSDYSTEPETDQLVLKAGKTSEKVKIAVLADTQVEADETVVLTLQAPATAEVNLDEARKAASLKIEDDDEEEEVEDVLLSVVVEKDAAEDDKDGFFEIAVSKAFTTDVTISYSLSGTAVKGSDYSTEPEAEEVVLKAGKTSVKVKISPKADTEVEEEEEVILTLAVPSIAGLVLDEAKKAATLKITDNDEEVEDILLSVARGKDAAEPNEHGYFTISTTAAPQEDLLISIDLSGSAVAGTDFEAVGEQVTLEKGQTTVQVPVQVKDDEEVEPEETVILTLNPPAQAGVALDEAKKAATVKITDNDEEPEVEDVLISVEVATHANRDDKDGEFEIKVSQALDEDITINYSFSGTAKKDNEYSTEPAGEQLVLKAGKTSAKVKVKKQKKVVGKQTVVLQLTAPAREGVVLDQNNDSATMEIQSQEEVEDVLLSVVVEKDAGEDNKDGFFELKLSKALDTDLTIGFALTGTATAGTDYVSPGEQLLLKAGRTSIKIKIAVKADAEVEGEETVILSLQTPATAGVVLDEENQVATLKIQDNDEEPEEVDPILLSVTVAKDAEEDNKDGEFEILVSEALDEDLLISYSLSGTATAGTDYEAPEGQLLLKAGKKKEKVKIKVLADTEAEEQETVVLELAVPAMAGVVLDETKKAATLKIQDNDEEEIEPALLSVSVEKDAAEDNKDGGFIISTSVALPVDLLISYSLSGTATAGADYDAPAAQVTLKAGASQVKIPVAVKADAAVEGEETVILTLQAPATDGVLLDEARKAATLTIADNDEEEVPVPALLSVAVEKDAAEDDKDGFFEIRLSKALETDLTVSYTLAGTAQRGSDYSTEPETDQLVLKAGKTSEKVKITVLADTEVEADEAVVLTLQAPATAEVNLDEARKAASLKIEDDDKEEEVEDVLLSVVKAKDAAEDGKDGAFTIRVSKALTEDLNIGFSLSGTATAGADYEAAGTGVVLKAGEKQVQVEIKVKADTEAEGDETVVLELVAPTQPGVVLEEANKTASLEIKDNDKEEEVEPAVLSVSVEKDAAEDDEDGSFRVKLSKALATDISISYTLSGTATPGADYEAPASQLLIKAGQTSEKIKIAVKADEEIEAVETVILTLQAPATEDVLLDEAGKVATLKIRDNDEEDEVVPALLSVTVAQHAEEDDKDGAFLISSSIALPIDVTIAYTLTGTAAAGTDYAAPGEQVVLKAGKTSVEVPIKVKADTEAEGNETVVLNLSAPVITGLILDQDRKAATLNLLDNDEEEVSPVVLSVLVDDDATEDDKEGAFIIMLSEALDKDLTISYSLSGTATPGVDFDSPAGQLVLKAGKTSEKVMIAVKADTVIEGDETVILNLQAPATEGVVLNETEKSATLKIWDNDEDDTNKIIFLSVAVGMDAAEDDKDGYFVISSSLVLTKNITVNYTLSGTADAGTDYVSPGGPVVLKAGRKSVKVEVQVQEDAEVEGEEVLVLILEAPAVTGVYLDEANESATLKIKDNDEEEEVEPALLSVAVGKDAAEDDENGSFTLNLSKALDTDLVISYSLSGTAQSGSDYNTAPAADQLVLKAGQTSAEVAVNVLADTEVEGEETVVLSLQPATVAGVVLDEARQTATLKITDNDEVVEEPVDTYAVLPTLFTPNGDQMNDIFVLHAQKLRALHWQIYNRHGRLIYETKSVEDATLVGWDGTVNGEPQPEDSYIWILVYQEDAPEAGSTKLTGSVTLIR
jgi:uncharacterized delta-60 repeat protein/gliding motility-associated-like protein